MRWLSQLVAPGDQVYALSLQRLRRGPRGLFSSAQTPLITAVTTLLVSTIVCFLLARYLSDPIRHLRAATRSIAAGDLGVRVSGLLGTRRDELALLALDDLPPSRVARSVERAPSYDDPGHDRHHHRGEPHHRRL